MLHPPLRRLHSYADGGASLTTRLLVEAHLALCPTCPHLVLEHCEPQMRLPEATISDEIQRPSFDRVWAAVEQAVAKQRMPEAGVVPAGVLAALPDPAGWNWVSLWRRRVKVALLTRDADTGSALYLSYYGPRSRFPRRQHVGLEENVILSGGYQNGEIHVEAGDWVIGAPGTEHTPGTWPGEDCWCLSRIERPGLRFYGWRGWMQRRRRSRLYGKSGKPG